MAMTKWGRKETMIWPPHSPIYTYGAIFMAVVLTGFFFTAGSPSATTPYSVSIRRSTSDRALQPLSERAVGTTIECSCWALVEFHRVWRRTPT